jgi:hypothetical protein
VDSRIGFSNFKADSYQDPFDLSSLSFLTASISELNFWTSEQWNQHEQALHTISESRAGREIAENEEVLRYCRQLVGSLRRNPSSSRPSTASLPFITLGPVLIHAFQSTDKIEYLDESIAVLRDGFSMTHSISSNL